MEPVKALPLALRIKDFNFSLLERAPSPKYISAVSFFPLTKGGVTGIRTDMYEKVSPASELQWKLWGSSIIKRSHIPFTSR